MSSPRLSILPLILLLLLTGAGCSHTGTPAGMSSAEAVTPKAYRPPVYAPDFSAATPPAPYKTATEPIPLSGQNIATTDEWNNAELEAARFLRRAPIYFYYDSAALTTDAKTVLKQKAERIKGFTQFRMTIAGHCDERGTDEYNMDLGARRAKAAYDYLRSLGVAAVQLESISHGNRNPAFPGNGENFWSQNRRCEFIVNRR